MIEAIKKAIEKYIQANDISIARLEKKAGLKTNAIRNILNGKSLQPSAATLKAISEALGCSIDSLLSEDSVNDYTESENLITNFRLFSDCVDVVLDQMENKKYTPSFKELIFFIKEVYDFSIGKENQEADKNFANWIINKNLKV
ncbi:hypothetical protein phytr_10240 [Candidatus Phycorickettsia trachydisci]|uniref:HTH cro/C1-type domain-containing protein n=1 Tax=Candidatus Phycorickettsia trachydisci TaxID=2115978 RepID=A0A2P1P9K0_9RICK|nr:helix-turn-helix transcriptional regulator [Candidatus Phycorickettsia trachydisci]AVP87952.1 hypothetical protein phytr_10240 [Candidatus Phycorickettsia trachydisci]